MCSMYAQPCLTVDPPGSSVHGILQGRILAWIAMPFSSSSSQPRDWTYISCIVGRFFFFTTDPPGKPQNVRGEIPINKFCDIAISLWIGLKAGILLSTYCVSGAVKNRKKSLLFVAFDVLVYRQQL